MAYIPSAVALAGGLIVVCLSRPTLFWKTALECLFATGFSTVMLLQVHAIISSIG